MKLTLAAIGAAMLGLCALLARSSVADAAVPASLDTECDLQDVLALDAIDVRLHDRLQKIAHR